MAGLLLPVKSGGRLTALFSGDSLPAKPAPGWSWVDDFILELWKRWKKEYVQSLRGKGRNWRQKCRPQTSFAMSISDAHRMEENGKVEDAVRKLLLFADETQQLVLYDGTPLTSIVAIAPPGTAEISAPGTATMSGRLSHPEYEEPDYTPTPIEKKRRFNLSAELERLERRGEGRPKRTDYIFTLNGDEGKIGVSKISELVKLKADYDAKDRLHMILDISNELGLSIGKETTILDFGCGSGTYVYWLRRMGFKAFGVDIGDDYKWCVNRLTKERILSNGWEAFRLIETGYGIQYRIPFPDGTFDFVFSDQVFEHVRNYEDAVSEIFRVLKPGGLSLHIFPSRYRIIEGHTYVPFATIFQGLKYFMFWALLGIRNEYQKGLDFREVAHMNVDVCSRTNYLSKRDLRAYFSSAFGDAAFVEDVFARFHRAIPRWVYETARVTRMRSFLSLLVGTFGARVVCVRKNL